LVLSVLVTLSFPEPTDYRGSQQPASCLGIIQYAFRVDEAQFAIPAHFSAHGLVDSVLSLRHAG
jgi:hypothetical protein